MSLWTILVELCYSILDAIECGDLAGHLAAWWDCVRCPEITDHRVW